MPPAVRAALLAALLVAAGAGAAAASPGWVYDRLSWNPDGDTLCVLAWPDPPTSGAPPRRLFIPTDPAAQVTVSPDVRSIQVSADGTAALLLGDQGLWWYEPAGGRLVQLRFQAPSATERLYDFAFRDGPGAVFLTGAAGDRAGGLYRWIPGTPVLRTADHRPGAPPPVEWTAEARPAAGPNVSAMRSARRITVPGTPPLVLDYDGRLLVIDSGYGGNRAELPDVEVDWAAWPEGGGRALVAVTQKQSQTSQLLLVTSGGAVHPLLAGRALPGAWLPDGGAFVNDASGRLLRYDPAADSLRIIELDRPPEWARRLANEATVASLMVTRWPRSARRFENQQHLVRQCVSRLPADWRRAASANGPRQRADGQLVGVYASLEDAETAAATFRETGMEVRPVTALAREMAGDFDYGHKTNGPNDRAWIHRLPTDGGGAEIWLERVGQAPVRLLSREMTR